MSFLAESISGTEIDKTSKIKKPADQALKIQYTAIMIMNMARSWEEYLEKPADKSAARRNESSNI